MSEEATIIRVLVEKIESLETEIERLKIVEQNRVEELREARQATLKQEAQTRLVREQSVDLANQLDIRDNTITTLQSRNEEYAKEQLELGTIVRLLHDGMALLREVWTMSVDGEKCWARFPSPEAECMFGLLDWLKGSDAGIRIKRRRRGKKIELYVMGTTLITLMKKAGLKFEQPV